MTGAELGPVLITFLVVNVILLVRAGARGRLGRQTAATAGWPAGPQVAYAIAAGPAATDPTEVQPPHDAPTRLAKPDPPEVQLAPAAPTRLAAGPTAAELPDVQPATVDVGRDTLTGLEDQATWDRRIADESARTRRYRRPVTIVCLELDGLDRLVGLLGEEAGDRLVRAMADMLRRLARDTDHVARLGRGRFGVLMPETPEEAAVRYVERVSRACELWLEFGAIAVRLAIGWAATSGGVDLAGIERFAMDRMHDGQWRDRRRAGMPAKEASVANDAGRSPGAGATSAATPRLDWDRCRLSDCDHKADHRRDRQR